MRFCDQSLARIQSHVDYAGQRLQRLTCDTDDEKSDLQQNISSAFHFGKGNENRQERLTRYNGLLRFQERCATRYRTCLS